MWEGSADTYKEEYRSQEGIRGVLTFMHFQLGISTTTQSWRKNHWGMLLVTDTCVTEWLATTLSAAWSCVFILVKAAKC